MNGICHVEIPCTDFEKVTKFYGDVFNWETQVIPAMDYAMFNPADGPGGGFNKQLKKIETHPIFYIEVADIDATLKNIEAAGGKMSTPKTQISPDYGFLAAFTDIEGNSIGLWAKE